MKSSKVAADSLIVQVSKLKEDTESLRQLLVENGESDICIHIVTSWVNSLDDMISDIRTVRYELTPKMCQRRLDE